MTLIGVVFAVTFFTVLAVMTYLARKKLIDDPIAAGRARGSLASDLVDDLQKQKWFVIIGLALIVFLDKVFHVSGGFLQSRWVMTGVIALLFIGRLFWRRVGRAWLT